MKNSGNISEKFLHYIWKSKLFDKEKLTDDNGNKIEVISAGMYNTDAGPDFFSAKIKIEDTIWAGNIEIHINSSDWYKHNHHTDKAYNNVILQVALNCDREILSQDNKKILSAELKFDTKLIKKHSELLEKKEEIPCKHFIAKTDTFLLNSWLSSVLVERAEQKTKSAKLLLEQKNNNWEDILYIITAKSFGFKINSLPFEMLAKSLPLITLAKHKNSKFQLESLLFGQAGMLDDNIPDDYYLKLKKEYKFLKSKYKLKPIEAHLWKFLRIRPSNFPTVRISQFADLIYKTSHLFSKITEIKNVSELEKIFSIKASKYWDTHYKFGTETRFKCKKTGKSAINSIIINSVIPVLFLYGKEKDNTEITEKAVFFLENMKPEKNNITKKWENTGLKIKNAYFSQSLIQLYNEYCSKKRCLECRIGYKYIQNT